MALLDKLKKKSDETSVGTEVIDLYTEICSLEQKFLSNNGFAKDATYIKYFENYCNELQKIKSGKNETLGWGGFSKKNGFDIPKKYKSLFITYDIENVVLKKFEDKLNAFSSDKYTSNLWWCPIIESYPDGQKCLISRSKVRSSDPNFELIKSSDKKNAIKEIKKLCASSKEILLKKNYKLTLSIRGIWTTIFSDDEKDEIIYKTKKADFKNYEKEIDNFFELFTKKYLNMKI